VQGGFFLMKKPLGRSGFGVQHLENCYSLMMDARIVKRVCGIAPIVMSLIALALVIEGAIEFGNHPPADEGWQAHIFQILMIAELPVIFAFMLMNRYSLKRILPTLGAQVLLWLIAAGALRFFSL
jgi:hypothetical protein